MCGIAGFTGKIINREKTAEAMKQAMFHRGPDEQHIKHFDHVTLVHNRLKILDLTPNGSQPMCNEDKTVWIVFNGEIYNHHELRTDLEKKGHIFSSHSDTEVIIHLYEEKGVDCINDISGMFAFAIYDLKADTLFIARDRFGIKPVFYIQSNEYFAFASEINALLKIPSIDKTIDEQAVYDFSSLFMIPAPQTLFKNIRAILPGQYLVVKNDLQFEMVKYYSIDYTPDESMKLEDALERSDKLISDSVKSQLESEVPLGSLLSGGIDSSLVSYYAQKNIDRKLKTFNVKFPDSEYDETWAAVAVAESIQSDHHTLLMDTNEGNWEHITSLLLQCGQPFADTSLFAVNSVSSLMKKHVTVALSGDGGDEAFGGYNLYLEIAKILRFQKIPFFIRSGASFFLRLFPSKNNKIIRIKRGLEHFNTNNEAEILRNIFSWLRRKEHQKLWKGSPGMLSPNRYFETGWNFAKNLALSKLEKLSAATNYLKTELILANDYLFKVDTASMRESLEVRVPLLDEKLFEYGIKLPYRLMVKGNESKYVLRELSRKILPLNVANKPKQGFGIPVDSWTNSEFKVKVKDYLIKKDAYVSKYLDKNIYESWVIAFCNDKMHSDVSREGLYQRVIMLLSLELHLEKAHS